MTDLTDLSIVDAAELIRSGSLLPTDLVTACLQRIEREEPRVAAFAAVDVDAALAAAEHLTAELRSQGPRGPLHGIPVGIKDVMDARGLPTCAGSAVLDGEPADGDAPAVAALRAAGAVVLGKTTTHEFAFGCETPPTRNPWDLDRTAGGSSGGSAAALAAGECLAALGTDSGGSVRIPAALCGVTGMRPRVGRVPLDRTVPFSWTHDTVGPLARTAADVALVWSALTPTPPVESVAPSELRIAAPPAIGDLVDVDPEIDAAVEAAIAALEAAGAVRVDAGLPRYGEWDADRYTLVLSDFLAAHTAAGWYPARLERYGDELRRYFAEAERIRGADVQLARRRLDALAARFRAALDGADVLALPTVALAAPRADGVLEGPATRAISATTVRLIRTCAPISYCGLAAVSVPCGLTSKGLPIGLQLVGRDEPSVLGAAMTFQSVTDHHMRRPGDRAAR